MTVAKRKQTGQDANRAILDEGVLEFWEAYAQYRDVEHLAHEKMRVITEPLRAAYVAAEQAAWQQFQRRIAEI